MGKAKKPYNITYSDKVSIGGMSKGKSSLSLQTIRMIHSQETVFFMTLQMQ